MPSWEWALVALLVFGALQMLALRYALRGEGPEVEGPGADGSGADGPGSGVPPYGFDHARPARDDGGDGARECPRCGAENRTGFTYCRNCVTVLGA